MGPLTYRHSGEGMQVLRSLVDAGLLAYFEQLSIAVLVLVEHIVIIAVHHDLLRHRTAVATQDIVDISLHELSLSSKVGHATAVRACVGATRCRAIVLRALDVSKVRSDRRIHLRFAKDQRLCTEPSLETVLDPSSGRSLLSKNRRIVAK